MTASLPPIPDDPQIAERLRCLEYLRVRVTRWANEQRGERNSALLEHYQRDIYRALDRCGEWRETP